MWPNSRIRTVAVVAVVAPMLIALSAEQTLQGPGQSLPPELEVVKRATFRAWGSHGDFEPSLDAGFLYFGENGPDGVILKRASLSDGTVSTAAHTQRLALRLAAVPGNPSNLVFAWELGLGATTPYGISVLNLQSGQERELDVGSAGGDGLLRVSPSGRFLATGTAVVSSVPPVRGPWPWFPSEVAVFSLATGKRELTYKAPIHDEDATVSGPNETPDEIRVQIPDTIHVNWTSEDILVLSNRGETAFRRAGDAAWVRCRPRGKFAAHTGTVLRVYPPEHVRLQRDWDGKAVGLAPETLFGKGPPRLVYVYNLPKYAVVVCELVSRGPSTVETVVLKWRRL